MVAKSFQKYPQVGEPYMVDGRMYVKVDTGRTLRQVRFYSLTEYKRMYPDDAASAADPYSKTQKSVLGFDEGYITIFKGDTYSCKDELREAGARYTRYWGWSIAGGKTVPAIEGITPIRLEWDLVGNANGCLKPEGEITKIIDSLFNEPTNSTHQGAVGERLRDIAVTVVSCVTFASNYGDKSAITFEDENGNIYVWFTTAKNPNSGDKFILSGTVKEHKIYKGSAQTILTRCSLGNQ